MSVTAPTVLGRGCDAHQGDPRLGTSRGPGSRGSTRRTRGPLMRARRGRSTLTRAVTSFEVPPYAVEDAVPVDPARTALVVIDMQNDFVQRGGSLLVPDAEATIPAIRRMRELARVTRMRVVYGQDTHRQGDPEWEIWPEHCREG